ncbi:unnamed protein product [Effrenium voratum]|uniref:protein-tyrosine-phosphatase n=1 Tax=Effrenium voratum TaxID=2562239 RepID=A0AA36IX78_9DINO|nr:unnamed protein product [Effrenium voratum]CAJ1450564.1 unnamed protein product [Effrenium voratum]
MSKLDGAEVAPGLWVGGLAFAEDWRSLERLGVVRVLTVGTRLQPHLAWAADCNLTIKCYEIEDHPCADLLGTLPSALREIDKVMKQRKEAKKAESPDAGCGVLVHCASGISRSVSVCMAWLMLRKKLSSEEALREVRKSRPQALPNHGFLQSLRLLEKEGDLKAAHKLWQKSNDISKDSRDRCVAKLRDRADKATEQAARLEERLQRAADSELKRVVRRLRRLLQDIEKLKPRTTIDDNVAYSIRRTTAEKVTHLLSIWEPRVQYASEGHADQTEIMDSVSDSWSADEDIEEVEEIPSCEMRFFKKVAVAL